MRPPFALAFAATVLASATAIAAPTPGACPRRGALYVARPMRPSAHPAYRHELRTGLNDPGGGPQEFWRFDVVNKRTGRSVTTLRMLRPCGNGRLPCYATLASKFGDKDDSFSSEVIELDSDLSSHRGNDAPYALVLPGFPQTSWDPLSTTYLRHDLSHQTRARVMPDFEQDEVWIRSRCGR